MAAGKALLLFSCSAVSCCLLPHGLQHTRLSCPALSPEFAQTHDLWVSDAIQPSHPFSLPSPLALSLAQLQGLFQKFSSLHQVAKVLELQLQHQSFQWIFRVHFLQGWLVCSPWCPRDSQKSSPTPQVKHVNSSALCLLYGPTLTSIHDYCTIILTLWIFVR